MHYFRTIIDYANKHLWGGSNPSSQVVRTGTEMAGGLDGTDGLDNAPVVLILASRWGSEYFSG